MARVRISTTVDARQWAHARQLLDLPSSRLVDRALQALVEKVEAERERAALEALPYEGDPDLAWEAQEFPDLPYQGEIPREVIRLAAERRRRQRR